MPQKLEFMDPETKEVKQEQKSKKMVIVGRSFVDAMYDIKNGVQSINKGV